MKTKKKKSTKTKTPETERKALKQVSAIVANPWKRIVKGDLREVDVDRIEEMLLQRTEAKSIKNYAVADRVAAELQSIGIAYLDEKKEWYTKIVAKPVNGKGPNERGDSKGKRKRVEDAMDQEPTEGDGADDAPTSDDDDSEDDREDEAFVAKMQVKLAVQAKQNADGAKKKSRAGLSKARKQKSS